RRIGREVPGPVALVRTVQQPGVEHGALGLGLHREVGQAVRGSLVGPVEDLPVDEPAGPRQAHAPGTYATEREGNLLGVLTVVLERLRCRQPLPPGRLWFLDVVR